MYAFDWCISDLKACPEVVVHCFALYSVPGAFIGNNIRFVSIPSDSAEKAAASESSS